MYLKVAKRVNLKSIQPEKKSAAMYWSWMLTRLMVNISQYTHIQKHYIIYIPETNSYYSNYILI